MDILRAWETIIDSFGTQTLEFPTIPKNKRDPVWFSAFVDKDKIIIDKAKDHRPSSQLKNKRILYYKDFTKVLPLYYQRKNDEKVSKELTEATVNQVYFLSVIKHMYDLD